MPNWLNDAVFYEIYPQSFLDSNGDGIGDLNGITEMLDYLKEEGFNAIWLNPCFDSPFKDAGYDIRDYKKVAERYGSNEDLINLFHEAHERGIHVLLDLVPGHTSEEHPWFRQSQSQEMNPYSNRYIWTDFCFRPAAGYPFISGESERSGAYILNFFKCQPALNYGFLHPTEEWQFPMDHPDCIATRESMKDIMRFWLEQGCDGFRVDMASSLVKGDDEQKSGTSLLWRNVRKWLDIHFPNAALVSEWGNPVQALNAGFHMDFMLNEPGRGYNRLTRDYQNHSRKIILARDGFIGDDSPRPILEDHSYFRADSNTDALPFLQEYMRDYETTKSLGYISLISCNHDTVRPSYNMNTRELKLFYSFLLSMPGVPFMYYGDEIGMRYQNLPSKEGGYFRTGSRTPMQWEHTPNLGFSETTITSSLYLPVDPAPDAPTAEDQITDPDSLLNSVRAMTTLRHRISDLKATPNLRILYAEKGNPLCVFQRGHLIIAMNPSMETRDLTLSDEQIHATQKRLGIEKSEIHFPDNSGKLLYKVGNGTYDVSAQYLNIEPQSFVIFQ